jgi:hypothetical protein
MVDPKRHSASDDSSEDVKQKILEIPRETLEKIIGIETNKNSDNEVTERLEFLHLVPYKSTFTALIIERVKAL